MYTPEDLDHRRKTLTNIRLEFRDDIAKKMPTETFLRMLQMVRNYDCPTSLMGSGELQIEGFDVYFFTSPETPVPVLVIGLIS